MKYLRRLVWYIASRLLVICCVLGLMVTAFYFSMNAANIYVVLKDGMAKRAQVIMMGDDASTLNNYFAASYLERDEALVQAGSGQSPYQNYYTITGFDHRINMTWVWCWPWEDNARATITESIPAIDGKAKAAQKETMESLGLSTAPQWQSVTYSVVLTRENGQWRVKNLTVTGT